MMRCNVGLRANGSVTGMSFSLESGEARWHESRTIACCMRNRMLREKRSQAIIPTRMIQREPVADKLVGPGMSMW